MPAAKLCSSGTLNAMKLEEGNNSLDTFIRQAIGKEHILPSTKTADSQVHRPVQWIQWFNGLDQPDLPYWPIIAPVKVPMQKCEKCSREFCSPVNYRRHIRVHRRSLNVNKECHKNRDLLASFWDKIPLEQAKEVVSFDNVMLKEIPGSSVIKALASSVNKPGNLTLSPIYVSAGNVLLDIILAEPSRLPISSQELFSILDDASERTFLCAGTAESVQKYVFDGETAKNCLELKNLLKAWMADKDAEALRCQKLLMEEEEAEQKRQAELLEKKRQKKLRQKEQKMKEQFNGCSANIDVKVDAVDGTNSAEPNSAKASGSNSAEASGPNSAKPSGPNSAELSRPNSAEPSGPSSSSDSSSNSPDIPTNLDSCLEATEPEVKESNEEDSEAQLDTRSEHIKQVDDSQTTKIQKAGPNGTRQLATNCWQASKPQRGNRFGSNPHPSKFEPVYKLNPTKDRSLQDGIKIWTKKLKIDTDGGNLRPPPSHEETSHQIEEKNCEVIIGSISVILKNSVAPKQDSLPGEVSDISSSDHAVIPKKNASEKATKTNHVQSGNYLAASKHWRPVRHGETKSALPLDRGNEVSEGGAMSEKVPDRILSTDERSEQSQSVDDDFDNQRNQICELSNEDAQQGYVPFSSVAAKEFLAQMENVRQGIKSENICSFQKLVAYFANIPNLGWKEAISADHVKLVLSGPEPQGESSDLQSEPSSTTPSVSDLPENQIDRNIQVKISKKLEKGVKINYIPKQKAAA
ncbi:hypothetical protein OROHE_009876 [Orobanche hederae]